ncbi:MAG: ATP-binding protein [Trebonia sp.]
MTCLDGAGALAIVVTDACPLPPVKRIPLEAAEHGRGLHLVEALSARWGWRSQDAGKSAFAILAKEA